MTEPTRHPTLAAALAAFQATVPTIGKGSSADTGAYAYSYAALEDITAKVLPLLAAEGLSYTCSLLMNTGIEHPPMMLRCTLLHETGENRISDWPVLLASPQNMGSAVTYGRRYMLLSLTGVAPGGEDDDGKAAAEDAHPKAGKSHAALVKDTVKTPRKATRTRGRPAEDDPWQTPAGGSDTRSGDGGRGTESGRQERARSASGRPASGSADIPPAERPEGADPRSAEQSTAIFTLLGQIGLAHDRDQSIALLSALAGRKLASSKELTRADAHHVINSLQELRDSPDAGGAIRTLVDAGML